MFILVVRRRHQVAAAAATEKEGPASAEVADLQPVKEVKIFGIWIMNNYSKLLSTNWNRRVDSLRKSMFPWTVGVIKFA